MIEIIEKIKEVKLDENVKYFCYQNDNMEWVFCKRIERPIMDWPGIVPAHESFFPKEHNNEWYWCREVGEIIDE